MSQNFTVRAVPKKLRDMLIIALVLAVVWWIVSAMLHGDPRLIVWDDLRSTFSNPTAYLSHPYDGAGYFAAPWANIFLLPYDPLPLPVAALAMTATYFLLIACLVYKFGGNRTTLLIVLTSVLAVDTAIEINIDWIVCLGLLVPQEWSGPFLMVKPQTAFGYVLSFKRWQFVRATIVALVVILISLLIWDFWPLALLENIQRWQTNALVNIAPMALLPHLVAIGIGIVLAIYAFRKRDPILCTVAGVFFVPYIAPTSFLIGFALLAVRYKRFVLLASVVMWGILLFVALPFFK